MVMNETFDMLEKLQGVLVQKNRVSAAIDSAPKLLVTQEELLARLKKGYIEKNEQYESVRKHIADLKTQLFEAESARERSEKAMDTINTQREYEALDKEIREATEREQTVRKEIQKDERVYQDLDEELKREEALIQQQEQELNDRKDKLAAEISSLQSELKSLEKEEQSCTAKMEPDLVYKFERIVRSKDSGIVKILGKVCNGCHMILPAQLVNDVRSSSKIKFCPYCSRILRFDETSDDDGTEIFFSDEDAGSLADLDDFSDEDDEDADDDGDDADLDDEKMDYEE